MPYFDNAATTRPCETALRAVTYMAEVYGNPSSLHIMGFEAEQALKDARRRISDRLGGGRGRVIFTGSGTEANNLAVFGLADRRSGSVIVTTDAEHPSVLEPMKQLAAAGGYTLKLLPTRGGCVDLEAADRVMDSSVALLSTMLVNNETGAVFPVLELARMAERAEARFHIDAVQAFGKLPFSASGLGCHALTVSAHKVGGLKGVGALWLKEKTRLSPLILGGGQEEGLRSGTENVPGIAAFAAAADHHFATYDAEHIKQLYDSTVEGLLGLGAVLNRPQVAVRDIVNFSLPGLRSQPVIEYLSGIELFLSAGSACSAHADRHSHVLTAMGLAPPLLDSALRISFSMENDESDVEQLLDGLKACIDHLAREEE